MNTILVPTDFSKPSENALQMAINIAERTGATIRVKHVIEGIYHNDFSASGSVSPDDSMENVFVLKVMQKAKLDMKNMLAKYDLKGIKIEDVVTVGSVFDSITTVLSKEKIDLIVIGKHGKEEKDAGSNAIKLIRKVSCPILVVKDEVKSNQFRKLILATDFETISESFTGKIIALQEMIGFELHLLYVNTQLNFLSTEDILDMADSFMLKHKFGKAIFHTINDYSEEDGIKSYAKEIHADVIALPTHGRKGISLFLYGSVTDSLIEDTNTPVLTFKI